jgi:hypothetical protein
MLRGMTPDELSLIALGLSVLLFAAWRRITERLRNP